MNNNLIDFNGPDIATSLLRNKLFNERLIMLESMIDDNDHQRNITIDNVYRIAFAMFNDGRSFILPHLMMKELASMTKILQNDKEALLFVKRYEHKMCS